jgi:hypothetical protein
MIAMPNRSWWPLLVVAVLLVLAGGAAAVATPQLTRVPVPGRAADEPEGVYDGPTPSAPEPSPAQGGPAARPVIPDWALNVLGGLLIALIAGGLAFAIWLMARGRVRSRAGQIEELVTTSRPAAEQVVAAVDAGLSDLSDTDLDPRRAVIACWLRLEQVAAAAGTPRQAADTPADLVTRLLAAHHVDPAVLAGFAEIYRRARYATHTVDEQMRGQARTALERVRSELTGVQGRVGG